MPRRIALALALALTVVTTFSIVVVGTRTGLFGGHDSARADTPMTVATIAASPTPPAAAPPQQTLAPIEPVYVTEYVYVDEPAPPGQARAQASVSVAPTASGNIAEPGGQPTTQPLERPTEPPAAAPTQAPPAPTAPAPTIPPTSQPATPPPPAAPAPKQTELEFRGTVSAIAGSMVTFTHGGSATTVKVTNNIDRLHVGSTVKVHAIWVQSGYYVAKELEFEEGN